MKYLIDTSVWSLVLRRHQPPNLENKELLSKIIDEGRAVLCGPVRQELLSGIKNKEQFLLLKTKLRYFEDLRITNSDYELAAEYFTLCRARGVQGSNTDFLLCALASNNSLKLLTTDKDFLLFRRHLRFPLQFISL